MHRRIVAAHTHARTPAVTNTHSRSHTHTNVFLFHYLHFEYKNSVSLIPRLNASIAFSCLVLNVYRILVSTPQSILFHLLTDPTVARPVGCGFGGRRIAGFRRFLGRRNGVVHRLSSAPVPTTCFARGCRRAMSAVCRPIRLRRVAVCLHIGKPRRVCDFPSRPASENSVIIAPNRTYAPLACFYSLPPTNPLATATAATLLTTATLVAVAAGVFHTYLYKKRILDVCDKGVRLVFQVFRFCTTIYL